MVQGKKSNRERQEPLKVWETQEERDAVEGPSFKPVFKRLEEEPAFERIDEQPNSNENARDPQASSPVSPTEPLQEKEEEGIQESESLFSPVFEAIEKEELPAPALTFTPPAPKTFVATSSCGNCGREVELDLRNKGTECGHCGFLVRRG